MKKSLFLSFFSVILVLVCVLCGVSGTIIYTQTSNTTPTTPTVNSENIKATEAPTFSVESKEPIKLQVGTAKIIAITNDEEDKLIEWSSSNEKIATVDCGGRVDAVAEGKATVTATFSDNKKSECEITVTKKAKDSTDKFSTSINANQDVLKKNLKNTDKNPYYIFVNRQMNCVTVYTYDKNGKYNIPVRAMVTSCGMDNGTITGDYNLYFKTEWNPLFNNVYGHYVSGISGNFLFHSVPYYSSNPNNLEVEEYNKLGTDASLGCVRMAVADTKWIYDNCKQGTPITIYDSDEAGPLGKPEAIKITDKSCGWDPTDNNKNNPYNKKSPQITGAKDITIKQNSEFNALNGIKALDTCSNDITKKLTFIGNVITSRCGEYKVSYHVTDVLNRTAEKTITVTVK